MSYDVDCHWVQRQTLGGNYLHLSTRILTPISACITQYFMRLIPKLDSVPIFDVYWSLQQWILLLQLVR